MRGKCIRRCTTRADEAFEVGIDYLPPIFTDAIGNDDAEHMRQTLFDPGNLTQPYHSMNTDMHKRIRYLDADDEYPE